MDTNSTIELKGTGIYTRWTCDICGELQEKDGMDSRIVGCGYHYDICCACLDAGIEGAAARSMKHAEQLEEWAALHRAGIPDVLRHISEWKSGKDYDAVYKAFEDEIRADLPADNAAPARVYDFPDGWDSDWTPSFEISLDDLLSQRGALTAKIEAMDKEHNYCGYCKIYTDAPHNHCVDCATLEGELHEWGCEMERCPYCGWQLIDCRCYRYDEKNNQTKIDRYHISDEERAAFEPLRLPFVGDGSQLPAGYIPINWRGEFDGDTGNGDFEGFDKDSRAEFLRLCSGGWVAG